MLSLGLWLTFLVPARSEWSVSWGSCSQECGGGTQSASLSCEEPGTCGTEPVSQRACNTHSCQWQSSSWSSCSQPCGGGKQTRTVTCPVNGLCSGVQPVNVQDCNTHTCQWETSAWGNCSQPCGGGKITRTVTCPFSGSCSGVQPVNEQDCNTHTCQWEVSWGPCSEECGGGVKEATASCPVPGLCSGQMPQPRDCNTQACGCGIVGKHICYFQIGSCNRPEVNMDECREVSYQHSYVRGESLGLCTAVTGGGGLEFNAGAGVVGGAASVEASITAEVCYESSTESGTTVSHLVKVPAIVGKNMVACAQGLHHDFGSGRYWLSYRQGDFTICEDNCPEPACLHGPDVTANISNYNNGGKARMSSLAGQIKSCIGCLLVAAFLSTLWDNDTMMPRHNSFQIGNLIVFLAKQGMTSHRFRDFWPPLGQATACVSGLLGVSKICREGNSVLPSRRIRCLDWIVSRKENEALVLHVAQQPVLLTHWQVIADSIGVRHLLQGITAEMEDVMLEKASP